MEQTMGSRIAAGRKKLGLTQDQLAEKLGVTAQAVSKWENNQSCPDISLLPKLAELFGTTTDALLGREQPAPVTAAEETAVPRRRIPWDDRRTNGIAFAALVLLVGGVMLAAGLAGWDVSFWELLWPSALLVLGLRGLLGWFSFFSVGCTLFGGYFLLNNLEVLPFRVGRELIFPIILLIIGIAILADVLTKPNRVRHCREGHDTHPTQNSFRIDGETFTYAVSFGEQSQLLSMPRLSRGEVNASFGECGLDLSGVETISRDCVIDARCSFGELHIRVPRRYQVLCDSSTAFASVDISGQPDPEPHGTIILKASASFGQIGVTYI